LVGRSLLLISGALFVAFVGIATHGWRDSFPHAIRTIRTVRFTYSFTVGNISPGADRVEIFVPVPKSDSRQRVSNLGITCPYPYSIETEVEYGNRILKVNAIPLMTEDVFVSVSFTVTRVGYHVPGVEVPSPSMTSEESLQRFLAPDRLIPIDGKIAEEAQTIVSDDMTNVEKVKAIYDHVVKTVVYDKTGTGWGYGDAVYACDVRRGNCTDFHSLFIGMTRSIGVPARFVMGFPLPEGITEGEIGGYHCWAEFYIDGIGWLPVDASEASKHPERSDDLFGGLDPHRVQFTVGRDIRVPSSSGSEPLNYLIYPYVVVDGKPHRDVAWDIRFSESAG
jgi:transglutaminase-like putative cysteine protease